MVSGIVDGSIHRLFYEVSEGLYHSAARRLDLTLEQGCGLGVSHFRDFRWRRGVFGIAIYRLRRCTAEVSEGCE
jgi:hypothetical protein